MRSYLSQLMCLLFLTLIIGYGFVNYAFVFGVPIKYNIIKYTFVIMFYTYIAVLTWRYAEKTDQFNFDRATFVLIILFGMIRSRYDIPNERYYKWVLLILAAVIMMACIKNWRSIPKTNWRSAGVAILICFLVIPLSLLESMQPGLYSRITVPPGGFGQALIQSTLYNLSFVSLMEEILFRGILWGYLRKLGWNDRKIFWGQAILFWLVHLWRIGTPITFFVTIPITTIAFSLLVYRSRQLLPSILLHTFLNSFGPLLVYSIIH